MRAALYFVAFRMRFTLEAGEASVWRSRFAFENPSLVVVSEHFPKMSEHEPLRY